MKISNQRLRNLTTGRLHTQMSDIYEDIEAIIGEEGIMTHQLPNAMQAMLPWLQARLQDPRLWDEKYDPSHAGEVEIQPMTEEEKKAFFAAFSALPHPFLSHQEV